MLNILHEAGLPKDALAVLNGDEEMIGKLILTHPDLARVHFTGSMETMHKIIELIGKYIRGYRCFPEVIGETGGKDFMIVYDDQDPFVAATAITRSAFGYQGRKCSALSRLYMTNGMWNKIRPILCENMKHIAVGDVADFQNYLGAIISEQEYKKISGYITRALYDVSTVEVMGGDCKKDEKGYWIRPTVIVTNNPRAETMTEEIFGPVVTVYCMPDKDYAEAVTELCNTTSPYRLTGAISTQNVATLCMALDALRDNAGNIYDFGTTGAVVGRQPFGGAGKSGSNSKPGSKLNLYRWVSPQAVSLTHLKPTDFMPPHLVRG